MLFQKGSLDWNEGGIAIVDIQLNNMLKHGPQRYASKIRKLCDRLFQENNLSDFSWTRIYASGNTYTLCTNPNHYVPYYLDNYFVHDPCIYNICQLEKVNVWGTIVNPNSDEQQKIVDRQTQSNMHNGLCFMRKSDDYYETYDFATNVKDKAIINNYISHLSRFTNFINFFKCIADQHCLHNKEHSFNINKYINIVDCDAKSKTDTLPDFLSNKKDQNKLTDREKEVYSLIVQCYTNREIGNTLSLSHRTVEKHVTHIKEKMDCKRRIELMRMHHDAIQA